VERIEKRKRRGIEEKKKEARRRESN